MNSGISRAAKVLQRICGLADDGRLTDAVIAAVNKRAPKDLIVRMCEERLAFLKRLRTWPVFGGGWGRRVAEVKAGALRMAGATGPAEAAHTTPASGRGVVPINGAGQKGTAGGVVATGATAAQQAHQSGLRPALIIAILAVTVVLASLGWLFWRWRQQHQQDAPA